MLYSLKKNKWLNTFSELIRMSQKPYIEGTEKV